MNDQRLEAELSIIPEEWKEQNGPEEKADRQTGSNHFEAETKDPLFSVLPLTFFGKRNWSK